MRIIKHEETIEDYSFQLPFEADKSKSISEMTMDELVKLNRRLRMEQETEGIIFDLKRNSGAHRDVYDDRPIVDTITPINQLYHHGVLGMKWGVRKKDTGSSSTKTHADYKTSRQLKSKQPSELSNAELKQLGERLRLEKQYSQLTKPEISYGKKYVENFAYAAAPYAITKATSVGIKRLTPILAKKGYNEAQINSIANALPKIGAMVSFAVKVANDTRNQYSSNSGKIDDDKKY